MSVPVPDEELIPWLAFRDSDGDPLRKQLQADWKAILADKSKKAEAYQQFIAENAGLFFSQERS
jgi:hypothetical protein